MHSSHWYECCLQPPFLCSKVSTSLKRLRMLSQGFLKVYLKLVRHSRGQKVMEPLLKGLSISCASLSYWMYGAEKRLFKGTCGNYTGWLEQLRPSQRSQVQREQRQLGRGQLERQNRTVQAGNRHPKRRDRTAARRSGANNNRKC